MNILQTMALLGVAALLLSGCTTTTPPTSTTTGLANDGSHATTTKAGAPPATTTTTTAPTKSNPYATATHPVSFSGSGSSFIGPLATTWTFEYNKVDEKVQIGYSPVGSGKGISDIIAKNTLFGASDAPLSSTDKDNAQKNGERILQFPATLGVVALIYHVDGHPDLTLDGETIGKIYTGAITNWKDVAPGMPDASIARVARSDSSGTTFVFTDYLMHASTAWKTTHTAPSKTQIQGLELYGAQNDGVGKAVQQAANSIGYVELSFARTLTGISVAKVKSHDGEALAPSTDGGAKAAAQYSNSLPTPDGDWSKVSIVDSPGAGAYPLSSFTYVLVYQHLADYNGKVSADQLGAFQAWMWWSLHTGQSFSEELGYAQLPPAVVQVGEGALASMG